MYRILCLVGGVSESDLREVCLKIGLESPSTIEGLESLPTCCILSNQRRMRVWHSAGHRDPALQWFKVMLLQLLYTLLRYTSTVSYNYVR